MIHLPTPIRVAALGHLCDCPGSSEEILQDRDKKDEYEIIQTTIKLKQIANCMHNFWNILQNPCAIPVGIWCNDDIIMTSKQHRDIVLTS